MRRLLFGFTLVEVIIALTIAASGTTILHQGVMQSLKNEERRRWYEACAYFLDRDLETMLNRLQAETGPFDVAPGLPIKYKIVKEPATDIRDAVDLEKITITFTGPNFAPGPVVTYLTPRLRSRPPEVQ